MPNTHLGVQYLAVERRQFRSDLENQMKKAKRIYCIEGHHDWGKQAIEPTVEPMLQLLLSTGYWEDYVHRKCVTAKECEFYLKEEWKRCDDGSILYFAAHGGPGEIWLSGAPSERWCEVVTLDMISAWGIDCGNSLVHFGCCSVFAKNGIKDGEAKVREFIKSTDATYASGYAVDVDWLAIKGPPALALELMFFGSVSAIKVDMTNGKHATRMRNLAEDLGKLFNSQDRSRTCEFRLLDWWSVSRSS